MTDIVSLGLTSWRPELESATQQTAIRTIEGGGVLVLPRLSFELSAEEVRFLSPTWSDGRAKNISLDGAALRGAHGLDQDLGALARMIERFGASAGDLVTALFPRYAPYVKRARTSFRPQPAVGRPVSWRKDDARLHIDAFPSRPNHGERILRVFSNVNPAEDRVWRVGEALGGETDLALVAAMDFDDRAALDDGLRSDPMRAAGRVLREIAPGLATFLVLEDAPDLVAG